MIWKSDCRPKFDLKPFISEDGKIIRTRGYSSELILIKAEETYFD